MAGKIRKNHSDAFKLKVALAALKDDRTIPELCHEFGVAASQIYTWKKKLEENGKQVFADKRHTENKKEEVDKLHKIIGKLVLERDFLVDVLDRSK
jgi:transposase-like protein